MKWVASCLLCAVLGFVGRLLTEPAPQTVEVVKEVVKTEVVEKEVIKTKKVIQKPDGTVVTVEREKQADKATKSSTDKLAKKETPKPLAQYRAGISITPKLGGLQYGASAGYRITGPLWADLGYNHKTQAITLGLSVEF